MTARYSHSPAAGRTGLVFASSMTRGAIRDHVALAGRLVR